MTHKVDACTGAGQVAADAFSAGGRPARMIVAATWWQRLRGWFWRDSQAGTAALLLLPCRAVHSCFMRRALDVYFFDVRGRCVRRVRTMRPWRCAWHPSAVAVLELRAGQSWPGGWRELRQVVRRELRRWWAPEPLVQAPRVASGVRAVGPIGLCTAGSTEYRGVVHIGAAGPDGGSEQIDRHGQRSHHGTEAGHGKRQHVGDEMHCIEHDAPGGGIEQERPFIAPASDQGEENGSRDW
ncbi:DUF192 domain-containing protein [Kerstersia gyiorum]|nr:DUF192 domain-containing protein [Kerstersia gyiorum]